MSEQHTSEPAKAAANHTDLIRRSSRSVCANLTEAWRKRRYPAHFVSKVSNADTEAAETTVWLNFAHQCHYIDAQTVKTLIDHYDHICQMLTKMITNPDSWILKS